ncbi:hypothetical protein OQA88_13110 [Cercophora sp. LCS_1]
MRIDVARNVATPTGKFNPMKRSEGRHDKRLRRRDALPHILTLSQNPIEERDQYDQAEAYFNHHLHTQNRELSEENLRLKKLLRENGISWTSSQSPSANPSSAKRSKRGTSIGARLTRASAKLQGPQISEGRQLPTLPTEIQLMILELAMTSEDAIVDPLSKLTKQHMTAKELARGNQIAIGFLVTCRAYHVEGTRFLWEKNTFIFTSHHALRRFSTVPLRFRESVKEVTFRIVAKYYDDEKRSHSVNLNGTRVKLRITPRPKEVGLSTRGYKSYSWNQIADFLDALRPPFDPSHNKKLPRPRLLPNLESLRIDFVNFPKDHLDFPGHDLHKLASHDLGRTIDELMLTGLPRDDQGRKAHVDLVGLLRDNGLVIKASTTFIQQNGTLTVKKEAPLQTRVIRAWRAIAQEILDLSDDDDGHGLGLHHGPHGHHGFAFEIPPAPEQIGHPESRWKKRRTVWKRVPISRDSKERKWVEFSQTWGTQMGPYNADLDDDDSVDLICEECGEVHDPMIDHDF